MKTKTRIAAATVGWLALFGAGGSAALASQGTNSAAARAAASSSLPGCGPPQLLVGLHVSQAGLGNRGYILTLTNTANSSCGLYGYPGLGLEDASHHVLTSHTRWGNTYFTNDPGRSLIVLSPGETASADLGFGAGSGLTSDSVATYLEVTPPNATQHLIVRLPSAPVRINLGRLSLTAMARHTLYNT
jgi:hypothetical protein